jgi:hypothetical protein
VGSEDQNTKYSFLVVRIFGFKNMGKCLLEENVFLLVIDIPNCMPISDPKEKFRKSATGKR